MGSNGVLDTTRALREQERWDDEESVLAKGVAEFPESELILAQYGWSAQRQKKWADAVDRWAVYRSRFPDRYVGYALGCAALRETQRYEEAEALADEGLRLFPKAPEVLSNYAWIANRRNDHPEALRRWQAYIDNFPDDLLGYLFCGIALRAMRSFDRADSVLREGLDRHPSHAELLSTYAWIAYDRQDWPEALRRWTVFRDRHPDNPLGHQQTAAVLGWLGRFADADDQARQAPFSDPGLSRLMLRFESLGDNCEFGLVQRHFGVEPLGLLRWTGIAPAHLVNALDTSFDGVGLEEQTDLYVSGNEYVTENQRFGMRMHTFIPENVSDHERIFLQQCRRLRFLKDKLLGDLKLSEKIFVYKQREGRLSESEMWAISTALRKHGRNRLFCVVLSDDRYPAGTIRRMNEFLEVGYIDHLSPIARYDEVAYGSWLTLLQRTFTEASVTGGI